MKFTYHIIIKSPEDYDDAYELFENIQNTYNLYDNCVIDFDEAEVPDNIIIESTDKERLENLMEKLKIKYKLEDITLEKVSKDNTIIEIGRDEETGGFPV